MLLKYTEFDSKDGEDTEKWLETVEEGEKIGLEKYLINFVMHAEGL
jgi:hypothetical protein